MLASLCPVSGYLSKIYTFYILPRDRALPAHGLLIRAVLTVDYINSPPSILERQQIEARFASLRGASWPTSNVRPLLNYALRTCISSA